MKKIKNMKEISTRNNPSVRIKNDTTGITLIALVITIIVLIILAGVSISLILGQNGLIDRAKNGNEKYAEQAAKEKLEIALADLYTEKTTNPEYTEDIYLTTKLEEKGFIVNDEIITVDDYQFAIDRSKLEITEELGKASEETLLKPRITSFNVEEVDKVITASVTLKNTEGITLKYEIRKQGEDAVIETSGDTSNLSYPFAKLNAGTYVVTLIAINEYGATTRTKEIVIEEKEPSEIYKQIIANPIEYYGKKVKYEGTEAINSVDWRIFYADEEYIYLIADDYIENKYCPQKDNGDGTFTSVNKNGEYKAYFTDLLAKYNGSADIEDSRLQALNSTYFEKYTSKNANMKAVAYMMDTSLWNKNFKLGNALYAVGAPTAEILMKSYSISHNLIGTKEYKATAVSTNGYKMSKSGGTASSIQLGMLSSANITDIDKMYVKKETTKVRSYWIASPSADASNRLLYVNYKGDLDIPLYNDTGIGFRPVVCLPSSAQLELK